MAVSSTFSSPPSPTKGADLCETDVTDVAIQSVTLPICLCGLAGNAAVLQLLKLNANNFGIFHLAAVDFIYLLFSLPSSLLFLLENVSCSPIMAQVYVSFLFQLSMVSYYWGLFRLTRITVIWDMEKICRLGCHCNFPRRLLWALDSVQFWAFFALFTVIPTVTYLCPSQEQEHCRVVLISMFAIILLIFAAPVVITRTIDIVKAKCGSQQQQPKRRDTVIFIIVLFTLFLSLWNFLQQLGYIAVTSQVVFLLACIHSTIKPFIYFLAGRCWSPCSVGSLQLSLQRVFEEQKDKTAVSKDTNRNTGV